MIFIIRDDDIMIFIRSWSFLEHPYSPAINVHVETVMVNIGVLKKPPKPWLPRTAFVKPWVRSLMIYHVLNLQCAVCNKINIHSMKIWIYIHTWYIYIYKYVYLHTYIHTCMYPHDVFICVPWPGHARGTGGDRSAKISGVWWGVIHLVETMDKYHPHLMSNKNIPEDPWSRQEIFGKSWTCHQKNTL